jgi:hypothetical protein
MVLKLPMVDEHLAHLQGLEETIQHFDRLPHSVPAPAALL